MTPITLDLCPAGMKLVSKSLSLLANLLIRHKNILTKKAKAEAKKVKDASFERLQALAVQHANYNVNQSMGKRRSVQQKAYASKANTCQKSMMTSSDSGWTDSDED